MAHRGGTGPAGDGAYGPGRSTLQRRAAAAAAASFGVAFSAEDLAERVRHEAPRVSTATVYRALAAMSASGYVTQVGERDGAALYARCAETGHHHHVVCTACGATAHTPCPIAASDLDASAPEGFTVTSHEIRLYGLCAACTDRERAADSCSCDATPDPLGGAAVSSGSV